MAAGDLSSRDRAELDKAIRAAEQSCRFEFSVFIGAAEGDTRAYARRLHASLVAPTHSLLVMVDPTARVIDIVTGTEVRRHLTDREVELSILAMQTDFAADDFVGGLKRGIAMLAEHARPQNTLHASV
ncbi:DUF5130 domain-containing protein [Nocardioides sp. B-3]|uniref:DUF5130 domain-containing protein n=1 Tax=Nocardioides sp. B-3 TaxID=2895565 RepID=UPI0021528BC5|nr:DUF5130 domain-containing protein [Nocardioides sp. B-3]UUZ61880.1 DUF5130 domain-containing protein [Nocardioides sp. B-3]